MRIDLSDHLRGCFPGPDAFDRIMALDGEVYRRHKNRRTFLAEIGGRRYFVKIHGPSGWREILKNVLRARLPVVTARPEYDGIRALERLGVPTVTAAGFGCRGTNPARRESFIITEALEDAVSLEEFTRHWGGLRGAARCRLQRALIARLGEIARALHANGLNHRDFYLAHFLLRRRDWRWWSPEDGVELYLIDLHRVQNRRRTPRRWVIKDLAGLLFSSYDAGLTMRDYLRFLRVYRDAPLRDAVRRTARLQRAVMRRASRQYEAQHGTPPPPAVASPSFA